MPSIEDIPTRPPSPTDFGQAFNYSVWTPNTVIQLCQVPWNSDYRDIVKFANDVALQEYLASNATQPIQLKKMSYARVGDPVRINLPFNSVFKYNYIKVSNPAQPITATYYDDAGQHSVGDTGRAYYYFITDVKYIAPNTTEIHVQLDVWQTFGFDVTFGNCFIERGHIGIAAENAFSNNGRDFLTIPEGLDIGDEYTIHQTYKNEIGTTGEASPSCWVMMGIAADITEDPGTVSEPKLKMASGSAVEQLPQGCDIVFFKSINNFVNTMSVFKDTPWVTETIQFIMAIPPVENTEAFLTEIEVWNQDPSWKAYRLGGIYEPDYDTTVKTDWRADATANIPARYQHLKKFLTYPYSIIELTTYSGQPLILKPELMPGDDIEVTTVQHVSPPSPRWAIMPKYYNAISASGDVELSGEYLDFATFLTDFPQFTVMNNGYLNYLASNRNQIAYQYGAASWDYTRAMQQNDVQYGQANASIQNQAGQYVADTNARSATMGLQNQMTGANASRSIIAGGVGDLAQGNVAGAVGGALNTGVGAAMSMYQNSSQTAIDQTQATARVNSNISTSGYIADTNKEYGQFAAKGDYQQSIAGINARVQDAKMIQPTVSGQMGGESFLLWAHRGWNIYTKIKQINPGVMGMIGEYWLRYGYSINRFGSIPASLKVMDKFTYWKLKETYLTSAACPEMYKQTIRGIFEKGVTVWSDPSEIGTIDMASNTPLSGITL